MIKVSIDVTPALRVVDINFPALVPVIGVAVGEAVRNVVAPYPPVRKQAQPPKSAKQRRFIFAALRDGRIPYHRTGLIGRSWQVQPTGDGALLTNNAKGVNYVQSAAGQVGYHRGNWTTDQEAAEQAEQSGVAERAADAVLSDAIRKAGG